MRAIKIVKVFLQFIWIRVFTLLPISGRLTAGTADENIPHGRGGAGQPFGSVPFDRTQNERRGRSDGSDRLAVNRRYQNEAQMPNDSMTKKASEKRKGNRSHPGGQFGFESVSSLTHVDETTKPKNQQKRAELSASKQIKAQQSATSYPTERKNNIKSVFPDPKGRCLKDGTYTIDATCTQINAQSKTPLNRISATNGRKKNYSKSSNNQAQLSQQRQIHDTTVHLQGEIFYPKKFKGISEGNEFKNTENRSSTYNKVTPDQQLPSTLASPLGLDYSSKKLAIKFPPAIITNSSKANQPEIQKNKDTTKPPPNFDSCKSSKRSFTLHQYNVPLPKNFATDTHTHLLSSFNSSPTNNCYIPVYDWSFDETSGISRVQLGSTVTSIKVDELHSPKRRKVSLPSKTISNNDFSNSHDYLGKYSNYIPMNQESEYKREIDDSEDSLPSLDYQNTIPPINNFGPFDQTTNFLRASLGEAPGYVIEEEIYPTPPTKSSIKLVVKNVHTVEPLPEDLIQLELKEREYEETHFPVDNEKEDNRVWNSEKKDISSSDKMDEMGNSKNSKIKSTTRFSRDYMKQKSQIMDVSKKQSSHENTWNVEETWSKDNESSLFSRPGPHFAFEPKANSETNTSSSEILGTVDCLLLKHVTEESLNKADDTVHKVTVDLIDRTDAKAHETNFYSSSLTTLSIQEFPKKADDTAEENVDSKALTNADSDERSDQREATSEKQLDDGPSFYDEAITEIQRFFGEDAAIYEQTPQYLASGIGRADIEERSQRKKITPSVKVNIAQQFYFSSLAASKPAIEIPEGISKNDTLKDDEAKSPRADQYLGEGRACKPDEEFSESFVKYSKDFSSSQFSAPNQVDSKNAATLNVQKLFSFNFPSMSNGQTSSWSQQMSEDPNSFPSIESTIHFDAISQRNQTPSSSIDPSVNYTYNQHDLGISDATLLLHLRSLYKEQDRSILTSGPQSHVGDIQLRTNSETLGTSGMSSTNHQKPGIHHKPDELREIEADDGKGQFPDEFNRDCLSYEIKPTVESPIKLIQGIIPSPSESAYVEETTPEAETQPLKDSQAETLSKSDTDKHNQTEVQKRIIQDLEQIREKAKLFEKEIEDFTELENSNKHYYIEESLRRLIDKLDDLYDDIGDDNMLRSKRKEVYRYIFPIFDELDNKVQFNRGEMEKNGKG
ncbi:uncharacterized protein [Euwallacea similis]|uniref:uncharacterized protein isoform X2 n=1 Tax=Euwallacea similis TaxID=1736056 RepID=UPI00344C8C63